MSGPVMIEAAALRLRDQDLPFLSELGPYLLAALAEGTARDTRSIARLFGVSHALVIREAMSLSEDLGLIVPEHRGDRSSRVFLSLTPEGLSCVQEISR